MITARLFFRRLRIRVVCETDTIIQDIPFGPGLNIIRGKNTSGKSTVLNSLLYALGFEMLLGKNGPFSMKPALRSEIKIGNNTQKVIESSISLEIENRKTEVITVERGIVGGSADNRLVKVSHGAMLTAPSPDLVSSPYFIHQGGAAQREKGFHFFLARFLDLELPTVSTYKGGQTLLYLECLMSLMFIEQTIGWSTIQATTPGYGIKDVNRLAFEYLLQLDVAEVLKTKQLIKDEKQRIRQAWSSVDLKVRTVSEGINARANNLSQVPVTQLEVQAPISLSILHEKNWITLQNALQSKRERLIVISTIPAKKGVPQEAVAQIESLEGQLLSRQAELRQKKNEYLAESDSIAMLRERLASLETELQRSKDLSTLRRLGGDIDKDLAEGKCPTCSQRVPETLLVGGLHGHPMPLEDNIEFLKEQRRALLALIETAEKALPRLDIELRARSSELANLNQRLKDLNDLIRGDTNSDLTLVRERIELEESIRNYSRIQSQIDDAYLEFQALSRHWVEILRRESELPDEEFSKDDQKKLKALSSKFRENLTDFGFSSTKPHLVEISTSSYKPVVEDLELRFDASASDNIRISWAYALALQSVGLSLPSNHFGFSVFDEPGQHQIDKKSRLAFYVKAAEASKGGQVIVGTSESLDDLNEATKGLKPHILSFPGKLLSKQKASSSSPSKPRRKKAT